MKNVGTVDRTLRVILGLVLIVLAFFGPQTPWGLIGLALLAAGLILLTTGLITWCPIYRVFNIKTLRHSG